MIETPLTPETPSSPCNITISRGGRDVEEDEVVSFPECVDLARAVRYCSRTLIEGSWSEESTLRGRRPTFTPSNFESAKAFLRASVESLHTRERPSRSLSETPLTSRTQLILRMPTCHGCHGHMGQGQHQGSAPGKQHCTLEHSVYCRGGVIEDLSWRACPLNYQYNRNLDIASGPGFESTMTMTDFHPNSMQQLGPGYSTPVISGAEGQHTPAGSSAAPSQSVQHDGGPHQQVSLGAVSRRGGERFPGRVSFLEPDESAPPGGATAMSQGHVPLHPLAAVGGNGQQGPHQVSEIIQGQIDSHRANNQVENIVSDRPGGINITDLRGNNNLRQGVEDFMETVIRRRIPSLSSAQTAQLVGDGIRVTPGSAPDYLPQVIAAPVVHQPANTQHPLYPPQQPTVQQLQQAAPQMNGFPNPASGTSSGEPNYCYEWITDSRGGRILVRTPVPVPTVQHYGSVQQAPSVPPLQTPVQQAAAQAAPPVPLQNQAFVYQQQPPSRADLVSYRTEFRCSPTSGRQWQVRVPVPNSSPQIIPSPSFRNEWRIHPHTGVSYQVQVPVHSPQAHPPMTPQGFPPQSAPQQPIPPQFPPHQHLPPQQQFPPQQSMPHQQQQIRPQYYQQQVSNQAIPSQTPLQTSQLPSNHTQNSFQHHAGVAPSSSFLAGPEMSQGVQHSFSQYCEQQDGNSSLSRQERVAGIVSLLEGGTTRKQPKIMDFVKKCPARWSKQATMNNINLPLYAWGSVAELESSLSGRAEAMSEGVLLGKVRHLQNILEVCCLSSSSTDFTGYGWTLARDYATKVENEVEQNLIQWKDMQVGVRTATLVSSQMEHPRPPPPPREPKKAGTGTGTGEKKDVCSTYNKCKTEGKCEYEVAHPGKTCQRKHECSFCREKKKQSWKHQSWNCQNKPADG